MRLPIAGASFAGISSPCGLRRLTDVRRSDVQRLVDDLAPTMSGSRVRSVVNAIRSLYR
jgi:hypothetical protein